MKKLPIFMLLFIALGNNAIFGMGLDIDLILDIKKNHEERDDNCPNTSFGMDEKKSYWELIQVNYPNTALSSLIDQFKAKDGQELFPAGSYTAASVHVNGKGKVTRYKHIEAYAITIGMLEDLNKATKLAREKLKENSEFTTSAGFLDVYTEESTADGQRLNEACKQRLELEGYAVQTLQEQRDYVAAEQKKAYSAKCKHLLGYSSVLIAGGLIGWVAAKYGHNMPYLK